MNKKFVLIGSSLILATIAFGLASFRHVEKNDASVGNYSTNAATYYNGITATSGKQLAAQLHDLITSTHRTYTTYDDNGGNEYQIASDQYYENGSAVTGYVYEFYSGVKWPAYWYPTAGDTRGGYNREHCWCQSNSVNNSGKQMWGTTGGGSDMHHIRPVESRLNSTRNNHPYGEIDNRDDYKSYAKYGDNETYALGGYTSTSTDTFEPIDSKKGDVARIILYTYLHYNSYTVSSLFDSYGSTNGNGAESYFSTSLLSLTKITNQNTEAKALEMLLRWNTNDPVDDIERRRNEQVATYQGNRNPFIDNSSYADAIWGTSTVGIKSISKTTAEIYVNNSTTISATSSNSANISWSSSDTSIVTVSSATAASGANITIAGVSTGSAIVTASVRISGTTYSKTCEVTVNAAKTLASIAVSGATTSFVVGDTWDFGGTVTATYSDSSTSDVTVNATFSGYDMSTSGNQTVTVNYTEGDITVDTSYIIVVDAASGDSTTISVNVGTYATANNWSNGSKYTSIVLDSVVTASVGIGGGNTGKYYTLGNEWRYYQFESASILIEVDDGYALDRVTFTYGVTNTGILLDSEDNTVASGSQISISGQSVEFHVGNSSTASNGQVKFTAISVTYHELERKLTSLEIDTSEVQTIFYVGDTFTANGIVATAIYSDESEEEVTSSVTYEGYDMTLADEYTVVVSYTEAGRTRTAEYVIIVKPPVVEYITASVNKTYYVGETIVKSDITVITNLGDEVDDFNFEPYKFLYSDAASGGSLTNKSFTITYEELETTLTVQVQRKARYDASTKTDVLSQATTGITSGSYTNFSGLDKTKTGIVSDTVYAGQCAGSNSSIQLRTDADSSGNYPGIITTTSGGNYTQISVEWESHTTDGRKIEIFGKNTAYSSANDLFSDSSSTKGTSLGTITYGGASTSITIIGSYSYIGIRSTNKALYLTSISITCTPQDTASNVANYVMYEDTNNQCTTKFGVAREYFNSLTAAEKTTFMTSDDYVIATARERFEAWARNQGNTITLVNGTYTISNANYLGIEVLSSSFNNSTLIVVIVSFMSITVLAAYLYRKKKKNG